MATKKTTNVERYEIMFHIAPQGGEDGAREVLARIREVVLQHGGSIEKEGALEEKMLAYPIAPRGKGHAEDASYFSWMAWTSSPDAVSMIKKDLAPISNLLRYVVVKAAEFVPPARRIPQTILEEAPKEEQVPAPTPKDVEEIDREIEKLIGI